MVASSSLSRRRRLFTTPPPRAVAAVFEEEGGDQHDQQQEQQQQYHLRLQQDYSAPFNNNTSTVLKVMRSSMAALKVAGIDEPEESVYHLLAFALHLSWETGYRDLRRLHSSLTPFFSFTSIGSLSFF